MTLKSTLALSAFVLATITACSDKAEIKKPTTTTAAEVKTQAAAPTTTAGDAYKISAVDLFKNYKANEADVTSKVNGKTVVVTGVVSGIDTTPENKTVVHLETGDELTQAHFFVTDAAKTEAQALKPKAQVTLSCTKMSREFDAPKGEDCSLVK